jgi:hypothetical protein
LVATLTLCCTVSPNAGFALNWEGHEDWFNESVLMGEFLEGVPPPILKPLERCEVVRARHDANSYEQVALPGKNCVEDLSR